MPPNKVMKLAGRRAAVSAAQPYAPEHLRERRVALAALAFLV